MTSFRAELLQLSRLADEAAWLFLDMADAKPAAYDVQCAAGSLKQLAAKANHLALRIGLVREVEE